MFVNSGLRFVTKICMGFVVLWTIGNIMQAFLICRPFAAAYNPSVKGTCGNQVGSFIAIGAFNIFSDAVILTLPVPTVWRLKMKTGPKIGLTLIFLIGLLFVVPVHIQSYIPHEREYTS